jgi:predicted O-linked N-acetylglucosamine transferase (SPINDLY family)
VTFGSLNQFSKINDQTLRHWARLLQAVPDSRLILVCPPGSASEGVRALFDEFRISSDRIELVPKRPWAEYVQLFAKIDLALDSHPCNGMTTTCHALWMGLPVVTLSGDSAVSRAGASLLHSIGMPQWIARDGGSYVQLAAELARDIPRLAELRANLRSRMRNSTLMDAPRFARQIEAAYCEMWQRWCARATASPQ